MVNLTSWTPSNFGKCPTQGPSKKESWPAGQAGMVGRTPIQYFIPYCISYVIFHFVYNSLGIFQIGWLILKKENMFDKRDPAFEKTNPVRTQQGRTKFVCRQKVFRKRPRSDFQIAMSEAAHLITPVNAFFNQFMFFIQCLDIYIYIYIYVYIYMWCIHDNNS